MFPLKFGKDSPDFENESIGGFLSMILNISNAAVLAVAKVSMNGLALPKLKTPIIMLKYKIKKIHSKYKF